MTALLLFCTQLYIYRIKLSFIEKRTKNKVIYWEAKVSNCFYIILSESYHDVKTITKGVLYSIQFYIDFITHFILLFKI